MRKGSFGIARQAVSLERPFAALVAYGIGIWIAVQSIINMGVNMGLLPTKGLTLPLLSFGGSGIAANCVAAGNSVARGLGESAVVERVLVVSGRTIMIMAGGTGGHVYPGLAVANYLRELGWRVVWLGTRHGLEGKLVPEQGIEMVWLKMGGVRGKGLVRMLWLPAQILLAFIQSARAIFKHRPDVVLGLGGYTAFPGGLMASLFNRPFRALDAVGLGRAEALRPPRPAVRFAPLRLDDDRGYSHFLGRQPEGHAGAVVRRLPLDLRDPLPVAQVPGDALSVPFRAEERGTLRAEAEDGQRLEMSLDGGGWDKAPAVAAGAHTVAVRLPGTETLVYSLRLEPLRLSQSTPLPPLPDARLAALPRFAVLAAEAPQAFDLPAGGSRTFRTRCSGPACNKMNAAR